MASSHILNLHDVSKSFQGAQGPLEVLSGITTNITAGEAISVVGPSGSGKTTLLGLCAGLDTPTSGRIDMEGTDLGSLTEEARSLLRMRKIGFIFQNFQLVQSLSALENVCIPLELQKRKNPRQEARKWLNRVGLKDREAHYPLQLSGGEQQRVAIARACAHDPLILFADEPTGNLDAETGQQIEDLLFETHKATENTLILVTHDFELAARTDRTLSLKAGRLNNAVA